MPEQEPTTAITPSREAIAALGDTTEEKAKRKSVSRTVFASIGLGVVALVAAIAGPHGITETVVRRLTFDHALSLLLYAVVALLVTRRLVRGDVNPHLVEGSARRAVGFGLVAGGCVALALVGVMSLIDGNLSSDPSVLLVFSERTWPNMIALALILSVVAPLIEEVLFRGLLVESLRSRGRSSAILAGAVAFALWHLNPLALRYYVLVGFLLGYLYWRFGLAGSISAHAAFNSVLLVMGIIAISGGAHSVDRQGMHIALPPAWSVVTNGVPSDIDLAARSKTGAEVVVVHGDARSAAAAARKFVPPPGARSPHPITLRGGGAIRFGFVRPNGHPTDVVVAQRGMRRWTLTLIPEGSDQAERDFDTMLRSVRLQTLT